jgi:hypothetical protein
VEEYTTMAAAGTARKAGRQRQTGSGRRCKAAQKALAERKSAEAEGQAERPHGRSNLTLTEGTWEGSDCLCEVNDSCGGTDCSCVPPAASVVGCGEASATDEANGGETSAEVSANGDGGYGCDDSRGDENGTREQCDRVRCTHSIYYYV